MKTKKEGAPQQEHPQKVAKPYIEPSVKYYLNLVQRAPLPMPWKPGIPVELNRAVEAYRYAISDWIAENPIFRYLLRTGQYCSALRFITDNAPPITIGMPVSIMDIVGKLGLSPAEQSALLLSRDNLAAHIPNRYPPLLRNFVCGDSLNILRVPA